MSRRIQRSGNTPPPRKEPRGCGGRGRGRACPGSSPPSDDTTYTSIHIHIIYIYVHLYIHILHINLHKDLSPPVKAELSNYNQHTS